MKQLSFVINNFNNAFYLKKTLNNFIKLNNISLFDIILVDDCSSDDSINYCSTEINSLPNLKIIKNTFNLGLIKSWKIGILNSYSKYIFFIDSDDSPIFDNFDSLFNIINTNLNVDIFVFNYLQNGLPIPKYKVFYSMLGIIDKKLISPFLTGNVIFSNSMPLTRWAKVYKRSLIIDDFELINDSITIGEDAVANSIWFSKAKTIFISEIYIYDYNTLNTNSIMRKKRNNYINKINILFDDLVRISKKYSFISSEEINLYVQSLLLSFTHYFLFIRFFPGIFFIIGSLPQIYKLTNKISIKVQTTRLKIAKVFLGMLLSLHEFRKKKHK